MQIVLLSGGSGKRLWPLSGQDRSKQFLQLLPDGKGGMESMIQRVVRQIRESGLQADVTISTNGSQKDIINSQLGKVMDMALEPERRDTFPAIALAGCFLSLSKGCPDDEVVVIMPCDPYTQAGYFKTLGKMAESVRKNAADLVLMGIKPAYPSSKYGYIVPASKGGDVLEVSRFTEKPDVPTAISLISGGALWNGGVFALRLGYLMNIVRKYISVESYAQVLEHYSDFPKISFDYEVVEKADSIAVVPYAGEWKDLGTWDALCDELPSNAIGRGRLGPKTYNVHIVNELDIPIFVDGLQDVVVAASADGILVCAKDQTENLKKNVENL